jgi:hypothetical protein
MLEEDAEIVSPYPTYCGCPEPCVSHAGLPHESTSLLDSGQCSLPTCLCCPEWRESTAARGTVLAGKLDAGQEPTVASVLKNC